MWVYGNPDFECCESNRTRMYDDHENEEGGGRVLSRLRGEFVICVFGSVLLLVASWTVEYVYPPVGVCSGLWLRQMECVFSIVPEEMSVVLHFSNESK